MRIEFQSVCKDYWRKGTSIAAVRDFSWELESGRVYGLLGRNAAGKTSLVRMLLDLIRPDRGNVLVDGSSTKNQSREYRFALGYLPEERGLYQNEKVIDTLELFAALKGMNRNEAVARAKQYLEYFELSEYKHSKICDLSKGLAQLVQFLSCIVHRPKLYIFDEPFSGLDPVYLSRVRSTMKELAEEGGLVICSTHLLSQAEEICDEVVLLQSGRTLAMGKLEELLRSHAKFDLAVRTEKTLEGFHSVKNEEQAAGETLVELKEGSRAGDFLVELAQSEQEFDYVKRGRVSLEKLFIQLTTEAKL